MRWLVHGGLYLLVALAHFLVLSRLIPYDPSRHRYGDRWRVALWSALWLPADALLLVVGGGLELYERAQLRWRER